MIKRFLRYICETLRFILEIPLTHIKVSETAVGGFLRRKYYKTCCVIDTNVVIKKRHNFASGIGSCLYHGCYILNTNGKFVIGNNSHLGAFCYVNVCYGTVTIGDDVAIGPGTKIIAYSNNYQFGKKVTQEKLTEDIIIGNNVFIGANCVILPGTVINSNAVIGAGSVVNCEIEENSVYAGLPAKKIKNGWYK